MNFWLTLATIFCVAATLSYLMGQTAAAAVLFTFAALVSLGIFVHEI
jgi:hypothetical protein